MSLVVHLGDVPLEIDTSRWGDIIGEHLQDAFDYDTLSPAKRMIVRLGMKALMHEVLDQFERATKRGLIAAPPPDQERADADVLAYGASYLAAFLIAEIEKLAFTADYEETSYGAIRITGLHAAPAVGAGADSLFLPAGPENGPYNADAVPPAATPQSAEPARDRGISGGYVDAGGDEGERQDVRREAPSAGAVETVS